MAKNYSVAEGAERLKQLIGTEFFSGHLFTTSNDFQLSVGKKGTKARLNRSRPTFSSVPDLSHDRKKKGLVDPNSYYLKALGVVTDDGKVKSKQHSKFKQISKFVETLDSIFRNSALKNRENLSVYDMGSGKGYLTFAAYDYLANIRNIGVRVIGVDTNSALTEFCNEVADAGGYGGLEFRTGDIKSQEIEVADILIALHACDTATDDALFKGISANSALIFAAPCCHRELRPQISPPDEIADVLKHPVLLEREAESVTDALRGLLLEERGYSTKIFEFIPTEHTPKNNIIVAELGKQRRSAEATRTKVQKLKEFYGIENQHLDQLLSK